MNSACDVAIIGAGPAGSVAAADLARRGWRVSVFEQGRFPRFSIGESLLPQSMQFLEQAGLRDRVTTAGFQKKDGAAFQQGPKAQSLDFSEKSADGFASTFEVTRADFDQVLAEGAAEAGANVQFGTRVTGFSEADGGGASIFIEDEGGNPARVDARLVLDASGFGRSLARLLDLERPSGFPVRSSLFRHFDDHIRDASFDREKILISIHPVNPSIWYWLIPLANGRSSVGVVGTEADIAAAGRDDEERFAELVKASGRMGELLSDAVPIRDIGRLTGYSASVASLTGPGWVLLGNAAEFLDPIFSSGVTIALKSASLAADVAHRQLSGEAVDWKADYESPLTSGIETFRAFVNSWYRGELQHIIMNQPPGPNKLKSMIISILAGYVWDKDNLFVQNPQRYLKLVHELC
ncbi:NAD(P)/FAD-dependent oxidoreductase [Minwuia sp.]|uniref:NAD(P)/FAD-dependent oxidoreductase n=1 Tax=Minwuia sp. TaxID=2493630 RepID=UPI003A928461